MENRQIFPIFTELPMNEEASLSGGQTIIENFIVSAAAGEPGEPGVVISVFGGGNLADPGKKKAKKRKIKEKIKRK